MNFTARPLSTNIDSNSLAIQRFSSARVSFNALDDRVPCPVTARSTDTNECPAGAPSTGSVNGQASHRLHLFALAFYDVSTALPTVVEPSQPRPPEPAPAMDVMVVGNIVTDGTLAGQRAYTQADLIDRGATRESVDFVVKNMALHDSESESATRRIDKVARWQIRGTRSLNNVSFGAKKAACSSRAQGSGWALDAVIRGRWVSQPGFRAVW